MCWLQECGRQAALRRRRSTSRCHCAPRDPRRPAAATGSAAPSSHRLRSAPALPLLARRLLLEGAARASEGHASTLSGRTRADTSATRGRGAAASRDAGIWAPAPTTPTLPQLLAAPSTRPSPPPAALPPSSSALRKRVRSEWPRPRAPSPAPAPLHPASARGEAGDGGGAALRRARCCTGAAGARRACRVAAASLAAPAPTPARSLRRPRQAPRHTWLP